MEYYKNIKSPVERLYQSLKKDVIIRVKRNRVFKGTLKSFDPHLNVMLENCSYTYNEKQEDGSYIPITEEFNHIILRGDNIVFIAPLKDEK